MLCYLPCVLFVIPSLYFRGWFSCKYFPFFLVSIICFPFSVHSFYKSVSCFSFLRLLFSPSTTVCHRIYIFIIVLFHSFLYSGGGNMTGTVTVMMTAAGVEEEESWCVCGGARGGGKGVRLRVSYGWTV